MSYSQGGGRSGLTLGYIVCHLRRQKLANLVRVRTACGSGQVKNDGKRKIAYAGGSDFDFQRALKTCEPERSQVKIARIEP